MAFNFLKFLTSLFSQTQQQSQPPRPQPPPAPTTRVVSVNVPAHARGSLRSDAGPSFDAQADSGGHLSYVIPIGLTGGATLVLTLDGYENLEQRVILPRQRQSGDTEDPELAAPIFMTRTPVPVVMPVPPVVPPIVTPEPPSTPLTSGVDMLDASHVLELADGAFLSFKVTAKITRLELNLTGIRVEFTKKEGAGRWPDIPFGKPGDSLQYSMGLCLKVKNQWYAAAPIQCWYGLQESGGQLQAQHVEGSIGQIAKNWHYDTRWGQLNGYQPKAGETIGFFVIAGNVRDSDTPLHERSNIVTFPLPQDGVAQTFEWS